MSVQKYNQGGNTSDRGIQLNDYDYSRAVVLKARAKNVFSGLAQQIKQRKHYGETLKLYTEFPIIDDLNANSQGVDAYGVKMTQGKWYSWDINGVRQEHNTKDEAKARVGQVRIESGDGNLGGSSRDISVQNGAIPALSEEGGVVNGVGIKRGELVGKINEFGISFGFTKKELELDTQQGLLSKYSMRLAEAYSTMRERQIRNGLLTAGLVNVTYGGSATQNSELNAGSELTYNSLRLLNQSLDQALVPVDTTISTGSTKVGTLPLPASRFLFIPYELRSSFEDLVNSRGESVFKEVEKYKDTVKYTMEGEIGSVGNFRIVMVHDMPFFEGVGADATADADFLQHSDKFNGYPILFVGDDAFATMALEGDVARVETAMPKADANNDRFGKKGSMSVSWYFGMLIKRPERIRVHMVTAKSL